MGAGVSLTLPPWRAHGPLGHILGSFAESVSLSSSYNFLVYKWAEVVEALLRLQAATAATPLPTGTVSLVIEDYGTIELRVPADGAPSCERLFTSPTSSNGPLTRGDRPDQLRLSQMQAMRLLFGPMPPSAAMAFPAERGEEAALLGAWCPLPLHWNHEDGV